MAVKPIELIALDIDGTLLTSESELSTRTHNVLQQAKKQGIRIILATGRILKRTLPLMKELELQDYLVVHNGAIVYDNRTNKIALKRGISLKLASDIIARLEKEQIIYYVFTGESGGEEIIAPKYVGQVGQDLLKQYSGENGQLVPFVDLNDEPIRITIIDDPTSVGPFYDWLQKEYGTSLVPILFGTSSDPVQGIEIMPSTCSKGSAISHICQELDINEANVLAFGDNNNDIEMLQTAGIGVAMGNASPFVQRTADLVAASNDDDGVAQVIEEIVLREE